jgi:xanthine dehydrogenase accessory factor
MRIGPWEQIASLHRDGFDVVVVTIISARGSVPGRIGEKAAITQNGRVSGNLGGGKVEAKALALAQEFLLGDIPCLTQTWNLQRDVGMTCGGEMTFLFEKITAQAPWHIAIFGAGHVSQALIPLLTTLACRIDVIDTRAGWLGKLPQSSKLSCHHVANIAEGVQLLSPSSYLICITQGHSSDLPVLREALLQFKSLPFLGVIGSPAKRAVLLRELSQSGIPPTDLEQITCPVGLPIGGNDPAEIAISIAAQLLSMRDSLSH